MGLLHEVGGEVDQVSAMLYDAGDAFDWRRAALDFSAAMGGPEKVSVGMTALLNWKDVFFTPAEAAERMTWALTNGFQGAFLWAISTHARPNPNGTVDDFMEAMAGSFRSISIVDLARNEISSKIQMKNNDIVIR